MKRAVLPISLGLLGLAFWVALFWWIFAGQREDVAVARAFLTEIAAENLPDARAHMTPALAAQINVQTLASQFGRIEPWSRLRFGSRTSNGVGPTRVTELWGTGIAVSGCRSDLYIRLTGSRIEAFDVTPLCPATGSDT